jgi:hypothetical protein
MGVWGDTWELEPAGDGMGGQRGRREVRMIKVLHMLACK